MMKVAIRGWMALSAFLCTRAVADEVRWTNVNSGSRNHRAHYADASVLEDDPYRYFCW